MTGKQRAGADSSMLSTLLFWGLAFLVLAAPLSRGLFYPIDYLRAQLYAGFLALLAGAALFIARPQRLKLSLVDFLALAFLFFYWLSIVRAPDLREAVYGAFRATVYILAFFLAKYLAQDKDRRRGLLLAVCFSTILISLTALLHAADVLPLELYNEYGEKRIISFLQHPNTFGIFAGLGILLGLGFLAGDGSGILKILLSCGLCLNALGLMGSQSRASWVITIILLFFQGLLIPGEQRKKYLLHLGVLFTVILVTSKGYLDGFLNKDFESALTWLITGAALSLVGGLLLTSRVRILPRHRHLERYRTAIVVVLCLLAVSSAATYFTYTANYLPSPASQLLTSEIIERAERISGQDSSFQGRLAMYRWALAIVRESPLFGWGEGGWESLYPRYQDKLYWSSEVHSHPLQLWVELGSGGFLAYLGLWLLILGRHLQGLIFSKRKALDISLFLALLALFLHSAVDFDLSLPAVSLAFWVLGGVSEAVRHRGKTWSFRAPAFLLPGTAILLAGFLFFPAQREYKAQVTLEDALEAVRMGYYPMATDKLQLALEASPFSGDIAAELALQWAYRYQDRGVEKYKEEAARYAEMSRQLNPYSIRNGVVIAKVTEILGDDLIEARERLTFLVPKMPQLGLDLARSYYDKALHLLEAGDKVQAREHLKKAQEELIRIQENYLAAGKPWNMRPPLETNLLLGKTELLLGDAGKSIASLQTVAGNNTLKARTIPWLALAYKEGQPERFTQYYEKQVKINSGYLKEYERAEQLLAQLGG